MSHQVCNENSIAAAKWHRFVGTLVRNQRIAARHGIDLRDALREGGNESKNRTFAVIATEEDLRRAADISASVRELAIFAGRVARRMDPKQAAPMLVAIAQRQADILARIEAETAPLLYRQATIENARGDHGYLTSILDGTCDPEGTSHTDSKSMPASEGGKGRAATLRLEEERENGDNNRRVAFYAGQSHALNIPALVGMVRDAPDYGFDSTPEA